MAIEWDDEAFTTYYRMYVSETETIGYSRHFRELQHDPDTEGLEYYDYELDGILSCVQLGLDERILVAGAGFGFLAETMLRRGFQHVDAVDSAPYIHAHKATEARVPIIDADVRTMTVAEPYDVVITESMMEGYSDDELPALCANLDRLGRRVIHLVGEAPLPPFQARPVDDWKQRVPGHTWIAMGRWKAC